MWIRSQDNELVQCARITPFWNRIMTKKNGDEITLGKYPTTARALEVLDEIQNAIINLKTHETYPPDARDGGYWTKVFTVFQMPEK